MKKLYLLIFTSILIHQVHSQEINPEILSTTGNSFTGSSVHVDWTLGELATTTLKESDLQITQGFHQPTYMVTSINEIPLEMGQISLYPVPTTSYINMELTFHQDRVIHFHLLDMKGQKIWSKEAQGRQIKETFILSHVPNGNYLMKISIEHTPYSQTFKIIKFN